MLDLDTRTAILRLSAEGHGVRAITRILKLSRGAVRKVLRSGVAEVPALERDEVLDDHLARVRELHGSCKGNLVRVHEELAAEGIEVGYSSLTSFLPPPRTRPAEQAARRSIPLRTGRGDAARHLTARRGDR